MLKVISAVWLTLPTIDIKCNRVLTERSWLDNKLINKDFLLAKAISLKSHIKLVESKNKIDFNIFLSDIDRQEIVLFNIQMSVKKFHLYSCSHHQQIGTLNSW